MIHDTTGYEIRSEQRQDTSLRSIKDIFTMESLILAQDER